MIWSVQDMATDAWPPFPRHQRVLPSVGRANALALPPSCILPRLPLAELAIVLPVAAHGRSGGLGRAPALAARIGAKIGGWLHAFRRWSGAGA